MKKILSILVLAIAAVQFAFAGDIITKDAMKLPLPARNFINRHFSNPQISHIKIENEILQTKKYDVLLTMQPRSTLITGATGLKWIVKKRLFLQQLFLTS